MNTKQRIHSREAGSTYVVGIAISMSLLKIHSLTSLFQYFKATVTSVAAYPCLFSYVLAFGPPLKELDAVVLQCLIFKSSCILFLRQPSFVASRFPPTLFVHFHTTMQCTETISTSSVAGQGKIDIVPISHKLFHAKDTARKTVSNGSRVPCMKVYSTFSFLIRQATNIVICD